ncbi:MAG: AMP-binding protein, partial [bacterium]|nr:AMP-binding protein [bacterium]
ELIELQALPSSVRTVNLAGEVLKGAPVERVYRQETIGSVFNLYGPSEDTTYSTWARIERGADEPTIGGPVADTGAYVLDRRQRPVAIGDVGELFLGDAGLARGYLDRPRRTAESFVPDPFRGEAGTRLYRTGDLARRLADGRPVGKAHVCLDRIAIRDLRRQLDRAPNRSQLASNIAATCSADSSTGSKPDCDRIGLRGELSGAGGPPLPIDAGRRKSMQTIRKKLVVDEQGRPQEVI